MIPTDKALEIVLAHAPRLPAEEVDFELAPGRILAEDVTSEGDLPPFDRAVVDGFAVRAEDCQGSPARLRIIGTVPAGVYPEFPVEAGEATQIMTGAPVPQGADAVQMVEQTRVVESEVEILEPVTRGQNISPRGKEIRAGDVVLRKGIRMDAASVAVAATVGRTRLLVGRRARVAVIATGDELVPPNQRPRLGQIRNSNGFSLTAQVRGTGADVTYLGVARDDETSLAPLIEEGLTRDVLLLSGGVSMGRLDLVEDTLKKFQVEFLFDAVALKPGKPTVFGTRPGGGVVFGLPGNPVSTMVTFELFVRPALAKMEGAERPARPHLLAQLKGPLASRGPRRAYLPGWLEWPAGSDVPLAYPIATGGSADIVAFSKANALLILPEHLDRMEAGQTVSVYPLDSFLWKEDLWHLARSI